MKNPRKRRERDFYQLRCGIENGGVIRAVFLEKSGQSRASWTTLQPEDNWIGRGVVLAGYEPVEEILVGLVVDGNVSRVLVKSGGKVL